MLRHFRKKRKAEDSVVSKAMRRAQRSAHTIVRGGEILDMVCSDAARKRLVEVAVCGEPPVTAISEALIKLLGKGAARAVPVRSFVGLCVRAALNNGFEVAETGVRVPEDPIFRTGSIHRRKPAVSESENDV